MMKRIRGEQIAGAVNSYMKKRQFLDNDVGPSLKERQSRPSVEEMALSIAILSEGSIGNYISYSSISGDATACDQQYTKIKGFISESLESIRKELQPLLYPLFVHVYLELLCNGQKTPAHKFFSRHHSLFKNDTEAHVILEDLQQMFNREDIENSKAVCEFRDHAYTISLTEEAIHYLFRYLKSEDNVFMLQLFNQHIDIKVLGSNEINEDANLPEDRLTENLGPASPPVTPENKTIPDELTLNSLRQSVERVREGASPMSSVCLYTLQNCHQGMCSAHVSPDQSKLCASFEDSSVRLWSLVPNTTQSKEPKANTTQVHLACDHSDDVREKNRLHCGMNENTVMRGHSGTVYKARFTHDSKNVLSVGEDTTVRLWDLQTHTNLAIYRGHNYPVWDLDVSNAGSYFVTASHDRTAKLWCLDRCFPLRTFIAHLLDVDCVKFHPNCNYIATGSSDNTVRLWSLQDGQAVRLFHGHRAPPQALAFSPDGKYLASAGEDRKIKIWDLGSGNLYKDLYGHKENTYSLSFSRDSSVLASGGSDCTLRLWDIHKSANKDSSSSDSQSTPELMGAFTTQSAVIHHLTYTKHNLLLAVGGISAPSSASPS